MKLKLVSYSPPLIVLIILINLLDYVTPKSVIVANYHNILLFFPKELGGNDDLRVIFDVRNSSIPAFKYVPVIVSVAYDSEQNQAYAYLESAVTSYIIMLKWSGGRWCHQVLFDFPASQFSKYMYHSLVLMENFLYWTTDRFVMSGRVPGYEKRLLLQPSWNRLYSMTTDKLNQIMYVAAFDYTENALFRCSLRVFSCTKVVTPEFPINYVAFNPYDKQLYVATIQDTQANGQNFLYRYTADFNTLMPIQSVRSEVSNIVFLDDERAVVSNQQTMTIINNINLPNTSRKASAHLIDPYALQYTFTFNQVVNFDSYPYPYVFSDYHELLYRNSLYLFYVYACGLDVVQNDLAFLPQMDLNSQFLRIDDCQASFYQERDAYLVPALIVGAIGFVFVLAFIVFCLCRSKSRRSKTKPSRRLKRGHRPLTNMDPYSNKLFKNSLESSGIGSISEDLSRKMEPLGGHENMLFYTSPSYITKSPQAIIDTCQSSDFQTSESYDRDPINLDCMEFGGSKHNRKHNHNRFSSGIYIFRKSGAVPKLTSTSIGTSPNSTIPETPPTLSQSSDNRSTASSASTNQRVKFNDYKIQHFFYDREDEDDENDEFPPHSKIYNQEEITPTKKKRFNDLNTDKHLNDYTLQKFTLSNSSLGTLSISDETNKDVAEITLDSNKLSGLEKKLANYYNKDYISTCNVALYGVNGTTISSPYAAANYLNILKAVGNTNGSDSTLPLSHVMRQSAVIEGDINI